MAVSKDKISKSEAGLRRPLARIGAVFAALIFILGGAATWLALRASDIRSELAAAAELIPDMEDSLLQQRVDAAKATAQQLRLHTGAARDAASDPLWTLASASPWIGENFSAVAEVARSADDVTTLGVDPLVDSYGSLDWNKLTPGKDGVDIEPLRQAAPSITTAARAVKGSADRLGAIRTDTLWPQVRVPLTQAQERLAAMTSILDAASDAANLAPAMMGADKPRQYLLLIQNNAEVRATGGIPGAVAVLTLDKGAFSLGEQSSAVEVGSMTPTLPLEREQQQIYSTRLGKYMQDVNLTPNFPSAATTAQAMWENKTGQRVDGVIAIDPVVLGYILQATGPIKVDEAHLALVRSTGLPTELTSNNVVQTLLSDVYAKLQEPKLQDAYFAGVAQEVFSAISSGKGEANGLISGITRGTDEGRILVWSGNDAEQSVISKYSISGSISGPSVSPAQFGVYFNDGTGAKMDYYVKRTVQLVKKCPVDGYEQTAVRVTSTNTAPSDAAASLPAYVTGGGVFGVSPGTVRTNIVVYGPVQANVESATMDGQKTPFAPYLHANRPVGVVAQQLAPGESKTVEFTFGKIVQHVEPDLAVTPLVQAVKDVILPTENAACG